MKRTKYVVFAAAIAFLVACTAVRRIVSDSPVTLDAPPDVERVWVGPETWANRLQDWRIARGGIECVDASLPYRTLHRTTRRIEDSGELLRTGCRITPLGEPEGDAPASAGILLGAGAPELDWRATALVQSAPGPEGGWYVGVDSDGRLFVQDFSSAEAEPTYSGRALSRAGLADGAIELACDVHGLALAATAKLGDEEVRVDVQLPSTRSLAGGAALVADGATYRFDDWRIDGLRVTTHDERSLGSILGAQHTLSRGVLKMTAQLFPMDAVDDDEVVLELKTKDGWREVARAAIDPVSWTATLRVEPWKGDRDVPYRLTHRAFVADGYETFEWGGTVRREPDDGELVLAAFTGNHNCRFGFGRPGYAWDASSLWFPHTDVVAGVRAQDPDLLFFSGDQVYEGASPTRPEKRNAPELDYLYKWSLWHLAFRELTRELPSVTIPDDHDVYQGNVWGAGGPPTDQDTKGGYLMPAAWVRMIERTQTSHLPDPFDPTPIQQGIGVYYTDLVYGGVSFAIVEDRKFKSGCADLELGGPRPDHIVDRAFDPKLADAPGKTLLGARQLAFLDRWARDWDGAKMKAVLSQSPFGALATHHGQRQDYIVGDLDSNGWPQSGRARAYDAIRKAFAFHVGGDQHLSTLVHHGIDDWEDATWSFAVPSIANFYARSWRPLVPPAATLADLGDTSPAASLPNTGRYFDGFGNRVTVYAVANPGKSMGVEPAALHDQMPGFGIVRFDEAKRQVRVECWPRSLAATGGTPYPGWPRTIDAKSCYGRRADWVLPRIVADVAEPIVQVFDGEGGLVYAYRSATSELDLGVFAPGEYVVRVGATSRTLTEHVRTAEPAPGAR